MTSRVSLLAVVMLALCAGLSFSFAEDDQTPDRGRFPEKMTVTVVDEAGNPITHAAGYHRFGKFVDFKVDDNGVFEIPMMPEEEWQKWPTADFTIRAEGYGPYSAQFESDFVIPDTFKVVLKPAQRIGGIVVDEDGTPLDGVKVELEIHFATSYKTSDFMVISVGTRTDADGKWSLFHLPATFSGSPSLKLEKEGYPAKRIYDIPVVKLTPDASGDYHQRLVIEKGYRFSGKVIDENGSPLEGVSLQMDEIWQASEPVLTDENGLFVFEDCQLKDRVMLTAWAPGKAAHLQCVEIRSDATPIEIVMTPGRTITFEVIDSAGEPIPEAQVTIAHINGLPGGHYRMGSKMIKGETQTDENGRLVWNEGPFCPFEFVCDKRNYIGEQMTVTEEDDTVRITLYRSQVVLKVVDDQTGEPIPAFTVVTRMYTNADDERFSGWTFPEPGSNGMKEIHRFGNDRKAWRFDIEAAGYEKKNLRKITRDDEDVELEVRLVKAAGDVENLAAKTELAQDATEERLFPLSGGKVLTPEAVPAAKASITVAVAETLCGGDADPVFADENGEFLLSDAQHAMIGPQQFVLKITHISGAAVIDGNEFRKHCNVHAVQDARPILLQPWGRIEGTLQAGTKKLEGTAMAIRWKKPDTLPAHPGFYSGTTTKKEGRFLFEQVLPGTIKVSRTVPAEGFGSSWSTYCGTIEVRPDETTYCTIGGTGRTVIGKAVAPEKSDYTKYTARIVPKPDNTDDLNSPELPKEYWPDWERDDPNACDLRLFNWYQTPEGKRYKELSERNSRATSMLRFNTLQLDGSFRFDDLPAGDYALVVSETGNCGLDFSVGPWHYRGFFSVSDAETAEPLDIGNITLGE